MYKSNSICSLLYERLTYDTAASFGFMLPLSLFVVFDSLDFRKMNYTSLCYIMKCFYAHFFIYLYVSIGSAVTS